MSGHSVLSVQLLIKGKDRTDWVINIPSEVPHHCCCTQQTLSLPASLPNWWPVSPSQTLTLWDWQLQPAAVFDYTVLYNIFHLGLTEVGIICRSVGYSVDEVEKPTVP